MFSVVCGSVQLLHGSLDSPELQQLLHTAREHWQADKAARIEADTQEQLCTQASPAAASNVSVPAQSSSPAAVHDTSLEGHVASSSCAMPRCAAGTGLSASLCHHPGAWQRVMAAVSKGSRGQLHYSPDTNRVHARASQATSGSPPLQQQQQEQARHQAQHRTGAAGPAAADWRGAPAAAASGAAAVHESSLSLTVASRGQSFWWVRAGAARPPHVEAAPACRATAT